VYKLISNLKLETNLKLITVSN